MDAMIDIETMGTSTNAAIFSIGAVLLDGSKPFYTVIDLESSAKAGLTLDASTVKWWMQQSEEAKQPFKDEPATLTDGLRSLQEWFKVNKPRSVWAWPPQFDLIILRNAYVAVDLKCPWHWRDERDMRTAVYLAFDTTKIPDEFSYLYTGVKHNALHDARNQARMLQKCFEILRAQAIGQADIKTY